MPSTSSTRTAAGKKPNTNSAAKKSGRVKNASKKAAKKKAAKKGSASKSAATKGTAGKKSNRKSAPKKSMPKKSLARKTATKKKSPRKWSGHVNETSDALDLKQGIFKNKDPKKIAVSLKKSAEESDRKKASPFQSAMSMLNFYINRGGENISASQMKVLEKAKNELRLVFGRDPE